MTPADIIDIAVQKAKADLLYELEYQEFIYETPIEDVNDELVQDFAQYCLTHIGRLCTTHAKEYEEYLPICNIQTDVYQIEGRGDCHVLRYRGYLPVEIRKVPHDVESILKEFGRRTSYFRRLVEDINWDFRARCKASEIAKIAVSAITDTILASKGLKLRILCSPDGCWRCLLYSDQESVGYSFFTTAETIVEDIMRILNQ
jgi:hypothetical protein